MNDKAHIFIISSWLDESKTEMNGSFVREQAEMLSKKCHKVALLHGYLKGKFLNNLVKTKVEVIHEKNEAFPVSHIGVTPVLPKMRRLSYQRLLKACVEYFEEYISENGKPDVIHSHAIFMGGVIASHLSRLFKVPFYHTEHTSGLIYDKDQYNKQDIELLSKVYKSSVSVFFVSSFFKERITENYHLESSKFRVLNNIVSPIFFNSKLDQDNSEFQYLIIGSLIPVKGHKFLLLAWKKLLDVYPEAKLIIAGDGDLKEELIQLGEELGITHTVEWKPKLKREEVVEEMKRAHVVLSSSRVETFGLTVAEALSMGIPVVVTSSGGVEDFVNQTNGIIVKQDVESYASGLIEVQKNYLRYNTETLKEQAKAKFGEEVIYEKLMAYYLHL